MRTFLKPFVLAGLISACGSQSDQREMTTGPTDGSSGDATPSPSPGKANPDPSFALAKFLKVTYTEDLAPLLGTHCTACHNTGLAKGSIRLDTVDDLSINVAKAIEAIKQNRMPPNPNPPLTPDQKLEVKLTGELLEEWKDGGSLLSYSALDVAYSTTIAPLSTAICEPCHRTQTSPKAIELGSIEAWTTHYDAIVGALGGLRMPPGIDRDESKRFQALLQRWEDTDKVFSK